MLFYNFLLQCLTNFACLLCPKRQTPFWVNWVMPSVAVRNNLLQAFAKHKRELQYKCLTHFCRSIWFAGWWSGIIRRENSTCQLFSYTVYAWRTQKVCGQSNREETQTESDCERTPVKTCQNLPVCKASEVSICNLAGCETPIYDSSLTATMFPNVIHPNSEQSPIFSKPIALAQCKTAQIVVNTSPVLQVYPLVNVYIAMENHYFLWVNPL